MESDTGTALVRGIWVAMAVAIIMVILRVYAKAKIHQFRADDVLMMIAMVALPLPTNFRTTILSIRTSDDHRMLTIPM
jgi:hypothetical protein